MIFSSSKMSKRKKLLIEQIKRICKEEFKSNHEILYKNDKYIVSFMIFGRKYSAILINLTQENSWGIRETLTRFNNIIKDLSKCKLEKYIEFDMNAYSDSLINGMYI